VDAQELIAPVLAVVGLSEVAPAIPAGATFNSAWEVMKVWLRTAHTPGNGGERQVRSVDERQLRAESIAETSILHKFRQSLAPHWPQTLAAQQKFVTIKLDLISISSYERLKCPGTSLSW